MKNDSHVIIAGATEACNLKHDCYESHFLTGKKAWSLIQTDTGILIGGQWKKLSTEII